MPAGISLPLQFILENKLTEQYVTWKKVRRRNRHLHKLTEKRIAREIKKDDLISKGLFVETRGRRPNKPIKEEEYEGSMKPGFLTPDN